jgi:AcrR family transcriptional regulator
MADAAPKWPPDLQPLTSPAGDETWEQLREAAIDLVIERGYLEFDVADILERAGVSRAEFDARFADQQDCLDRTYEANNSDFHNALLIPYLAEPTWREGIRAAVYGAAEYLRTHRRERRYGQLRKEPGGAMEMAMRDRYLQLIVDLIDIGRCELSDPDSISRTTAEGVLGSIYTFLVDRLAESEDGTLDWGVVDDVMYLAVRRYVGEEGIADLVPHASRRAPAL